MSDADVELVERARAARAERDLVAWLGCIMKLALAQSERGVDHEAIELLSGAVNDPEVQQDTGCAKLLARARINLGVLLEDSNDMAGACAQYSAAIKTLDEKPETVVDKQVTTQHRRRTISSEVPAVATDVDAGAAFAAAVAEVHKRLVTRATDQEIATVSELLETGKKGLIPAEREGFVVAVREMLDSKLLDVFDAETGDKLTLTLKNGQTYLQGGGTSRTFGEVNFRIDHREAPTFSRRPSRSKAANQTPEAG